MPNGKSFWLGMVFLALALAGLAWLSSSWVAHLKNNGVIGQTIETA